MIFTCFLQFHSSVVKDLLAAIEGGSKQGKHLHEPRESDTAFSRESNGSTQSKRTRQASIESAFTGDKFSQNKALNLYYK